MDEDFTDEIEFEEDGEEYEEDGNEDDDDKKKVDVSNFYNYQRAIDSLIDYLNIAIDDMIATNPRSDQLLFAHENKKLILNSILEAGFYTWCKMRLSQVQEKHLTNSKEDFIRTMKILQGEMDLFAYLLVNTRLAHRAITFDLYLSLLQGGLFTDIIEVHHEIKEKMEKLKISPDKTNVDQHAKKILTSQESLYI